MKKASRRYKKINHERLLLTAVVAFSFFGFVFWSIQQSELMDAYAYNDVKNPTKNTAIEITAPKINSVIGNPITVSGQADTAKGKLKIRIKDLKNFTLAETAVSTANQAKMSKFSTSIKYKKPITKKGVIEIFELSKENTEIYKLSLPIVFED